MRLSQAFKQSYALVGLLVAFLMAVPMVALSDESHVWFANGTSDGWAFVTEIHLQCQHVVLARASHAMQVDNGSFMVCSARHRSEA